MAEDKRIRKTKQHLKQVLTEMLHRKSFESITVKELCGAADTSRITFYSHYNDKYDLLAELFDDKCAQSMEQYQQLEKNNTRHDFVQSYCNMLESILGVYYENYELLRQNAPIDNSYNQFVFHQFILKQVEEFVQSKTSSVQYKYSPAQTTAFICYAIWGFITNSPKELSVETRLTQAKELMQHLLRSNILIQNA